MPEGSLTRLDAPVEPHLPNTLIDWRYVWFQTTKDPGTPRKQRRTRVSGDSSNVEVSAMVSRRGIVKGAAAVAVAFGPGARLAAEPAGYEAIIDPARGYGTWEGWGAALSWWANVFGGDDTLADLFYTRKTVSYSGVTYPGLGLNVVRYNVGACTSQPVGVPPLGMVASPNIPRYKQLDGYWLNWDSSDPASPSWNWRADPNQRAMLGKARDRGANLFEMFSCSPMWWMCLNHNPSGAKDGGNNLQPWNYHQHAVYLATVARHAHDHWGIDFASVEAFNEPSARWWTEGGTQEGCHVDASIQQQVIAYLRAELDAHGLTGTHVAASDETSYDAATATWHSLTPATKSQVGRVTVHGYQYGNTTGPRATLYDAVHLDGKRLSQSEYGEGWDHGLYLAYNLSLDLHSLHPTAWSYWQPVDGATWGLVRATYPDPTAVTGILGPVTNKYFVFAQYSRHVRPGMVIIDSGDQATVAAYDPAAGRLVLVTVCGDTGQQITYNLSRFSAVGGGAGATVRAWITDADPNGHIGRQYVPTTGVHLTGKQLSVTLPAHSIHTFEIDNVRT
jgi:galactan endo-1,6-beta-galactosidase